MNILPPDLNFNFGPEDRKLSIQCEYTERQTIFRLTFDGQTSEQAFVNIFGQPTVINLLSNRDVDGLDVAYPNEIDRIRFVKGILYVWVAYRLGCMDIMGVFSKLIDKKKTFEDYAHRELLETVIIPVLRSIKDGRRHLPDMPEAILVFSDISSKELETFLLNEVDKAEIFHEEEFKTEFKERLNQVNANLAIKAVQALSAADIDRISKIGQTIEELQAKKVDVPEFENMKEEFKNLCVKMEELSKNKSGPAKPQSQPQQQQQVKTINTIETKTVILPPDTTQVDKLIDEINQKKESLEQEIERFRQTMKDMENNKPQPQIIERVERVIVQQDFSSDTAQNKIMRNMNRKSLKVLDKMFNQDDE